ncbi:MAG: alpha-glucosidase [Sphingomonas sp.]|uniref:alpha-glucosidase n=1 Tax=Sphingomonas sp. TaxID=28214 RepID=UPI001ACF3E93|nr:alpha-glucosidase [Sphingomonas sp.]MBN8808676.1 alpha-glucosidase [Sphingomonas sp.]
MASGLIRKAMIVSAALGAATMPPAASASPSDDRATPVTAAPAARPWWQHAVIYEIYVRSFQDSNGDGIGDLPGVTSRLDYLKALGVNAIWLTPFYPSPNFDFGYDVSDYTGIAREYGTMADWNTLVREARKRGIRVLVDLVVNHSSDQHPWFKESRASRTNPKRDWYIWRDGGPGGTPPNNWQSIFGGPAWTKDPTTGQWYYHIFAPQQPDLNWGNPGLRQAMFDVVRFWLDHGAGGFRLDATPYLFENFAYGNDPDPAKGAPVWLKPYNSQLPQGNIVLRDMRRILDGYPGERVLLGESSTTNIKELRAVYGRDKDEINLPMNFLIGNMNKLDAAAFKRNYDDAALKLDGLPSTAFFSSHDHGRQWSAFGDGRNNDAIAKLTAALTLLQPGTALLYYGEEIGMRDLSPDQLAGVPLGPQRPRADERDKERSPMQWSDARNAGFSTGTPWLPADRTAAQYNVAAEAKQPGSLLNWYRKLTALRRDDPAFDHGSYVAIDTGRAGTYAFARRTSAGRYVLVATNAGATAAPLDIARWTGVTSGTPKVLADSQGERTTAGPATLSPYQVLVIELRR